MTAGHLVSAFAALLVLVGLAWTIASTGPCARFEGRVLSEDDRKAVFYRRLARHLVDTGAAAPYYAEDELQLQLMDLRQQGTRAVWDAETRVSPARPARRLALVHPSSRQSEPANSRTSTPAGAAAVASAPRVRRGSDSAR